MPAQRLYCLQNNPTIADEVYFSLIVEILNDRLNEENVPATISSYKNDSESLMLLEAEKEDTIDTLINSLKSKPITQKELDNAKAIGFFGKTIVQKLEQQHQDGHPNYFHRIKYDEWRFGCISEYIVPLEDKKYKVTVVDNVLIHPLYINQIKKWEEIKDEY